MGNDTADARTSGFVLPSGLLIVAVHPEHMSPVGAG